MEYNIFKNNRGGTVILMTVLILLSIVGVTLVASENIRLGIIAGRTQADATKAFFAAEAGAEMTLWEARKGTFDFSACSSGCLGFTNDPGTINGCNINCTSGANKKQTLSNNSSFKINYNFGANTIVKSYGSYLGAQRVVELSY